MALRLAAAVGKDEVVSKTNLPELFDSLTKKLLEEQPEDPLPFLKQALDEYYGKSSSQGDAGTVPPSIPRVIFDTDAGGDDAFAMLWLLGMSARGHCKLEGITTVSGNVKPKRAFDNVRRLLGLFPELGTVKVGVQRLAEDEQAESGGAAHIHGTDGMGGLAKFLTPVGNDAVDAPDASELIMETLLEQPGQITLVCVGPLTNMAAAEKRRPGVLRLAREIVWMGGSFQGGNITPTAEFNCYCDAEAVKTVLEVTEIVMLPLDVTEKLLFSRELLGNLTEDLLKGAAGSHAITEKQKEGHSYSCDAEGRREFIIDLAKFMWQSNMAFRATSGKVGFLVHDASVLLYLWYPETLKMQRARVEVSVDMHTYGLTFFDKRHVTKPHRKNAWVALEVDATNGLAAATEDLRTIISKS